MSRWTRSKVYLVDGLQPCQELRGDVLGLLQPQRAALPEHLEQGVAVHVLHGHQLAAIDLDEVEDPTDVGRNQLTGRPDLLPQQLEPSLGLEQILPQGLQPDFDPELEIEGPPDLTHPTATEHLEDLVAITQHLPGREESEVLRDINGRTFILGAGQRRVVGGNRAIHHVVLSLAQLYSGMFARGRMGHSWDTRAQLRTTARNSCQDPDDTQVPEAMVIWLLQLVVMCRGITSIILILKDF